MQYVYGCDDKEHPRVAVVHGMKENPTLTCSVCGKVMHRIPQPFTWGWHPSVKLIEHMDRRYTEWRTKQKAKA
jgi:hypothetical protein